MLGVLVPVATLVPRCASRDLEAAWLRGPAAAPLVTHAREALSHRLNPAVFTKAFPQRPPRSMQPNGSVASRALQAPRELGESRALDVHAAENVFVGVGQRLDQSERAGADVVLGAGPFELVLVGKGDLATPLP